MFKEEETEGIRRSEENLNLFIEADFSVVLVSFLSLYDIYFSLAARRRSSPRALSQLTRFVRIVCVHFLFSMIGFTRNYRFTFSRARRIDADRVFSVRFSNTALYSLVTIAPFKPTPEPHRDRERERERKRYVLYCYY